MANRRGNSASTSACWGRLLGESPANRSARVSRVLRWPRSLPSLRRLHRGLATVDDQAIALSLALVAYGSVSQARTTARLARRRQFFIHSVGLVSVGFKTRALGGGQSTEGPNASTHPTGNVRARNKLPKGLSRQGGVTALAGIVAIGWPDNAGSRN